MSNISNAPRKNRRGVGASCSVLLIYLQPAKLIHDSHTNKYKRDFLSGIIITQRDVIRVTRREQLCILMKHEEFRDHKLHWVQKLVVVIIEGSEAHALEDSEEKDDRGEVAVKYDSRETPIHATTREDINSLLSDA